MMYKVEVEAPEYYKVAAKYHGDLTSLLRGHTIPLVDEARLLCLHPARHQLLPSRLRFPDVQAH